MANPALAKLNSAALSKAVNKSDSIKPLNKQSHFKEMLNNMQSATEFADKLGMTDGSLNPTGNMKTLSGNGVDFSPVQDVAKVDGPNVSGKLVDMLSEVNRGQMQMDSMINQVLYSDKKFNSQELLAIQAHVFHYAQMTELTVKVAEHSTHSVKQILSTSFGG